MTSDQGEYIRVKVSAGVTTISGRVTSVEYQDDDTGMICIYVPALEIHSYGDDSSEAMKMFKDSLSFYLNELSSLSVKKIEQELFRLGWTRKPLKRKEFTPLIDISEKIKSESIKNYKLTHTDIAA